MKFRSDNGTGAAPEVLKALGDANDGATSGYGVDAFCERAEAMIRERLQAPEARVFFVATGTAANALALATLTEPWGTIYCHDEAHINVDECGAPEFFTNGAKLMLVDADAGKIRPENLEATVEATGTIGVHNTQRGALSLTNLTEDGAAYSVAETKALTRIAEKYNTPVHLDGARFANAIVGRNESAAEFSHRAGVDILVLGGTKNGLIAGEAVVVFDPDLAWEFELRRKRAGHLLSKGRLFGAQFTAYMENDNWLKWAGRANGQMMALYDGLHAHPDVEFETQPEGNLVYVKFPRAIHRELRENGAEYYIFPATQSLDGPDDEMLRARLVTSFATRDEELARFMKYFS